MPARIHGQTLPTISLTWATPASMRSAQCISSRDEAGRLAGLHGAHPVFEIALHAEFADHHSGHDRHREAQHQIEPGDLPAEQAEQQRQRHFIHHRRRDQEGEGDAQRYAGGKKTDEQRHRRAGAERCNDAQAGRHYVADAQPFAGEHGPRAFRRNEGMHHAHQEDDAGEQQQNLGRVVEEEMQGFAQMRLPRQAEQRNSAIGKRYQAGVGNDPCDEAESQPAPGWAAWAMAGIGQGGHDMLRFMRRIARGGRPWLVSRLRSALHSATAPAGKVSSRAVAHAGSEEDRR